MKAQVVSDAASPTYMHLTGLLRSLAVHAMEDGMDAGETLTNIAVHMIVTTIVAPEWAFGLLQLLEIDDEGKRNIAQMITEAVPVHIAEEAYA